MHYSKYLVVLIMMFVGFAAESDDNDARDNNVVLNVDVAWNGSSFKVDPDPEGLLGKFGGTHYIVSGIVYEGGTLTEAECNVVSSCGWVLDNGVVNPQFPDKIVGRITTTGWFVPAEHVDNMLLALTQGDTQGFIVNYMSNLGKITSQVTNVLELDAQGFTLTNNIVISQGMIGTIDLGEQLSLPIVGSSGNYSKFKGGMLKMTMLSLLNGTGAQSFNLSVTAKSERKSKYDD